MERIKIIANPSAGREIGLEITQELLTYLAQDEVEIEILFTQKKGDATRFASENNGEDVIACIGGDGTINEVVNGIYHGKNPANLAILPAGTVNDFGAYLNLPTTARGFYQMIKNGKVLDVDLGEVNDRVFINVAAGGMFTEIAHSTPIKQKTVMGKLAYYLEGLREFISTVGDEKGFQLRVKNDEVDLEVKALLFIIANSTSVGGFKNIAPYAEVHDGVFDVIIVEEMGLSELMELLADIGRGDHINNKRIKYFKTKRLELSSDERINIDVDGEKEGQLPAVVEVIKNAIRIYIN